MSVYWKWIRSKESVPDLIFHSKIEYFCRKYTVDRLAFLLGVKPSAIKAWRTKVFYPNRFYRLGIITFIEKGILFYNG